MKRTIDLCIKYNVVIGAHPSFFDKKNFGRTDMHLHPSEVYELVTKQIYQLVEIAKTAGTSLHHVKPHGALYNMAARSSTLSAIFALAVKDVNEKLIVYGLSGGHLIGEAKAIGLKAASEVFADRTYQDDGSLTPRSKTNAMIEDADKVAQQTLQMIKKGTVITVTGNTIPIIAESICIHGDGKQAVEFVKKIYNTFKKEKINIKSIGRN
jgi:UPF0271 protein